MSLVVTVLTLCAYLTSVVSGVLGLGGGAMLLACILLAGVPPEAAIPIHAAVQLVSNGSRVWAHRTNVRWRPFLILVVTALPFPIAGLWLLTMLDMQTVKLLIAVAVLYTVWAPKRGLERVSDDAAFAVAGVLGGSLGVVVGAVGPIIGPFFMRASFNKEQLIGTEAACAAYLHVLKLVAFTTVGFAFLDHLTLIGPMAIVTIAGTFTGKWILGRLTERRFVWLFRAALTLLAARLLLSPWLG